MASRERGVREPARASLTSSACNNSPREPKAPNVETRPGQSLLPWFTGERAGVRGLQVLSGTTPRAAIRRTSEAPEVHPDGSRGGSEAISPFTLDLKVLRPPDRLRRSHALRVSMGQKRESESLAGKRVKRPRSQSGT